LRYTGVVTSAGTGFQRARSAEHKERRASDLVDAARSLALSGGARTVTLTAIAQRAGVHPSAVRRYFDSREDILLLLAGEAWSEWADSLARQLSHCQGLSSRQLAALLAHSLAARQLFCDLLAHASLSLEREVPLESARSFKAAALEAADNATSAISHAMPSLGERNAHELVTATTALAAMLWQYANPPDTLRRLYQEDPRLAHTATDFVPRLALMAEHLLTGMMVHRQATATATTREQDL
jgi:AcrR family transcriptional regulator